MNRKYQAPTVRKAFQILELVAGSERGLTISDLSRELGISKSTVHGIGSALEDVGAVLRDPRSKRYTPGLILFELGQRAYSRFDLKEVARPCMEDLMAKTAETVFLGVRSGDHVSILDSVESASELKITSPVGTRIPLLAGATGKVFLATLPAEEAMAVVRDLGLHAYTSKTITDPQRYAAELEAVRRQGYALDDEEYIGGVRAVAASIHTRGTARSAIWVVGFTPSMSAAKLRSIAVEIRAAADAIGRRDAVTRETTQKAYV
jgi:DNA-binding IclR family transcriptional regulator